MPAKWRGVRVPVPLTTSGGESVAVKAEEGKVG